MVTNTDRVHSVQNVLRVIFGVVPIVAGADKFFNLLTNWSQYLNPAFELRLRHQKSIALRTLHGVTQGRNAAGNDRHLMNRVGVRQAVGDEGVTAFVIGYAVLLILIHDPLFLF